MQHELGDIVTEKFAFTFGQVVGAAREVEKDSAYERCPILGYSYVRAADGMVHEDFYDDFCDRVPASEDKLAVGCYVGAVLNRLGVPLPRLDDISGNFGSTRWLFEDRGITFTDKAFAFLDNLQSIQDDRETWKNAFNLAYSIAARNTWKHVDTFEKS